MSKRPPTEDICSLLSSDSDPSETPNPDSAEVRRGTTPTSSFQVTPVRQYRTLEDSSSSSSSLSSLSNFATPNCSPIERVATNLSWPYSSTCDERKLADVSYDFTTRFEAINLVLGEQPVQPDDVGTFVRMTPRSINRSSDDGEEGDDEASSSGTITLRDGTARFRLRRAISFSDSLNSTKEGCDDEFERPVIQFGRNETRKRSGGGPNDSYIVSELGEIKRKKFHSDSDLYEHSK